MVSRVPSKTRTVASLTSIIVMELLAAVPKVETNTVNRILPFVLNSFEGGITEDYRVCVHYHFSEIFNLFFCSLCVCRIIKF